MDAAVDPLREMEDEEPAAVGRDGVVREHAAQPDRPERLERARVEDHERRPRLGRRRGTWRAAPSVRPATSRPPARRRSRGESPSVPASERCVTVVPSRTSRTTVVPAAGRATRRAPPATAMPAPFCAMPGVGPPACARPDRTRTAAAAAANAIRCFMRDLLESSVPRIHRRAAGGSGRGGDAARDRRYGRHRDGRSALLRPRRARALRRVRALGDVAGDPPRRRPLPRAPGCGPRRGGGGRPPAARLGLLARRPPARARRLAARRPVLVPAGGRGAAEPPGLAARAPVLAARAPRSATCGRTTCSSCSRSSRRAGSRAGGCARSGSRARRRSSAGSSSA